MKNKSGYTLVELMVTVAILGILAGIAVPQYGDYVRRAKITEALAITLEAKNALIAHHAVKGVFVPPSGSLSERNINIGLQTRESYASENVVAMWVGTRGVVGKDSTSAHVAVNLPTDIGLQDEGAGYARLLSTIELVDGKYVFVCNDRDAVWPSNIQEKFIPNGCE